ncbi:MAG: hypothetical protein WEE66_03145, partial [Actinomycetota bacterium]
DVLQGDPNDPPSLNQFVYATGSPVTYTDPLGMKGITGEPGPSPVPAEETDPEREDSYPIVSCDCDGTQTASVATFAIPIMPSVELVHGGWYVADASIDTEFPGGFILGAAPDLRGDDRTFDSQAKANSFRISLKLDYTTGVGKLRVNPTCPVGEPCVSARRFGDNNNVEIRVWSNGTVGIQVSSANSAFGGGLIGDLANQTIDGMVVVSPSVSGVDSFGVVRESFPSFELYQGTKSQAITIFSYSEGSPYGLFFG